MKKDDQNIDSQKNKPDAEETEFDLKAIRESKGLNIREICDTTKISPSVLEAIESQNFKVLPEKFYSRAFIKTYAEILGIDSGIILSRYNNYLEELKASRPDGEYAERNFQRKSRSKFILWVAVTAIVIFLLTFSYLYKNRGEEQSKTASNHIVETIDNGSSQKANATQSGNQIASLKDEESDMQPPDLKKKIQNLSIEANETTWVKIVSDNDPPYEIYLKKGNRIERTASEKFILSIGNAGGVNIYFNDESLGTLGKPGEVIRLTLPKDIGND